MDDLQITELAVKIAIELQLQGELKNITTIEKTIASYIESFSVDKPVGVPSEPTKCELNNTVGGLETAKRWALMGFDEWNQVTGFVNSNTGYYYEIISLIEDAVEYGFGVAHSQDLKIIRQRIKKGQNSINKIKRANGE